MVDDGTWLESFGPPHKDTHTHMTHPIPSHHLYPLHAGGKAPMAHSAASAPASFPFSLPKYTAPVVSRQVRHAAEAYLTIISVATQVART